MAQPIISLAYIAKKLIHGPNNDVPNLYSKKFIHGPNNDVPSLYSKTTHTLPKQ